MLASTAGGGNYHTTRQT